MRMSLPGALAALLLLVQPAMAAPPAAAPDLDAMTRDDSALLGFLDGVALTPDEQQAVHAYLARAYAEHPDRITAGAAQVRQALALLARHNLAVALPSLTREPVAEQRAALLKWGEVNAPMRLAANTAAALEYRTRQLRVAAGGSSMSGQMATHSMMQQMTQRQMQQNVWSMRHPECGPVGGHPSSCSQAPIFTPIRPF